MICALWFLAGIALPFVIVGAWFWLWCQFGCP